jgi:hypothetical protein
LHLKLITAIDFTASNGNPTELDSLHFIDQTNLNQYEKCIDAIGNVLYPYDSDQLLSVFGFCRSINGQVSNCFSSDF